MAVLDEVKEMLAEKLEITEDSSFSDLGLDSLDMAEMMMDVENVFGVTMEADPSISTVGALVEKLESLK